MPDRERWSHEVVAEPDGTLRLDILDEWDERYPVARGITRKQAEQLLAAIEQEATRRRYAVAEIIRDPEFMAPTVIAVKRGGGR